MSRAPKIPQIRLPIQARTVSMPDLIADSSMSPNAFDELIKSKGVRMLHSKPAPCPNVRDEFTSDHDPSCGFCYNGFIYYAERELIGAAVNNTSNLNFNMNGSWNLDQATFIIPVHDSKGEEIDIQFFDQITLPDLAVRYYQRKEHSQSGIDRLQFPAVAIDYIIDASGQRYVPGVDVILEAGRLRWVGKRPGFDPVLNRGVIYSVVYYIRPTFTVIGLPHQLRVGQKLVDGEKFEVRYPQTCVVRKDFIPFDAADKTGAPDRPEPKNGSF